MGHYLVRRYVILIEFIVTVRGVFRTFSNIYDRVFSERVNGY